MVPLEVFYRIFLLTLARDSVADAFSVANFIANGGGTLLLNVTLQYASYLGTRVVVNQLLAADFLPIFANTELNTRFIQNVPNLPAQGERVATLVMLVGAGASIAKVGDVPFCYL